MKEKIHNWLESLQKEDQKLKFSKTRTLIMVDQLCLHHTHSWKLEEAQALLLAGESTTWETNGLVLFSPRTELYTEPASFSSWSGLAT